MILSNFIEILNFLSAFGGRKNRWNISRSIDRSLSLVLSFVKTIQLQRIPVLRQRKLVGWQKSFFTAAMEVVCSIPTTDSCTSLKKITLLSAGQFVDCTGLRGLEVKQLYICGHFTYGLHCDLTNLNYEHAITHIVVVQRVSGLACCLLTRACHA